MPTGKTSARQSQQLVSHLQLALQMNPVPWNAVVEVYSELWGQCLCFKGITQRLYFDYMDKMKFYVVPCPTALPACSAAAQACADKIESFAEFKDLPKPVFLLFKDGNKIDTIQGAICLPPRLPPLSLTAPGVHGPQIERSFASLAASIET